MARAEVLPISVDDLERVGEFLHQNLNSRLRAADWMSVMRVPWTVAAPNHGFRLVEEGRIVGVYLAFYSDRLIDGRVERFCNLGAWCVLPRHRLHSLLLLRALLAQKGYHFTDLSPSGSTVSVNERLKFTRLDTTTALMPNLPWPLFAGGAKVISDEEEFGHILDRREMAIFRDHQNAKAARHVLITEGGEYCYVMFRHDRRKRLPLFASLLYVSNPGLLRRRAGLLGRHLLFRHGVLFTLMELRLLGDRPRGCFLLRQARPKMFRSETLRPGQIDSLYSELVCVPW